MQCIDKQAALKNNNNKTENIFPPNLKTLKLLKILLKKKKSLKFSSCENKLNLFSIEL